LEGKQYLVGEKFTYVDLRLFMTLIRFDAVYVVHFKCNMKMIKDYPNLAKHLRHLYHDYNLKSYVDIDHIKRHYYGSHPTLNPYLLVPKGPEAWWDSPN